MMAKRWTRASTRAFFKSIHSTVNAGPLSVDLHIITHDDIWTDNFVKSGKSLQTSEPVIRLLESEILLFKIKRMP